MPRMSGARTRKTLWSLLVRDLFILTVLILILCLVDNKTSTLGDIDPCMIPLPEEVDDDGDLSDVVQVKAEPLVVAVPEDLVQNDIFSVVTPVLVKVDDAIVADSVASLSSPAHVGVTNNAKCADIGIEQATMPDIDIEGSQQASEEHSEEVIAKNALTPTKTSSSAALAIAESIISIHGLHEEQVGASIEVEESAGLPANAVQAVHEIGQNYWKSIFDASDDDLSSSVVRLWVPYVISDIDLELGRRAPSRLTPAWTRTNLRRLEKNSLCLSPSLRS